MSRLMLEAMEARRMMSVTLNPVTHVLTATGTSGSDQIVVSNAGTNVQVFVNGAKSLFAKSKVAKIVLNGLGSSDSLRSADTIKIPTTLNGGEGADYLRGGGGDDNLFGGNGNDVLDGGNGADFMSGGGGTDTIDYSHRTEDLTINLTSLADTLSGSWLHDIRVVNPNSGEIVGDEIDESTTENCQGGSGNDVITSNALNNRIWGNGGADTIRGGDGNDYLIGGAGQDLLYGEAGNDFIDAVDGKTYDIVDGGTGQDAAKLDTLTLKIGSQTFVVKDPASNVEAFV
jgi:Ca2+-binding RTX toxin-like protein